MVTFEEHDRAGGLGSLVSEVACEHWPRCVLRIGVQDRFSECCGTYDYLLKEHGLDLMSIRAACAEISPWQVVINRRDDLAGVESGEGVAFC